jgi:hypothetical protein
MKIYSIYILSLLVIFSAYACNNNSQPDIDTSLINITSPQAIPTKDSASTLVNPGNTAPATVNNSSVALNPPHGQPGHDCAIPVGSPLNGKPNAATLQSPGPLVTPALTTPPQMLPLSNSNNSVALNPPHGQPGHDCAIPVGQPL